MRLKILDYIRKTTLLAIKINQDIFWQNGINKY